MTTAVAMALYNGEKFLHKQLESIRTQTKAPDQVILCDDGSSDGTVQLVRDYIREHALEERWTLWVNEKNLGYARNFFHAMERCEADLIFLADQDDIWKPDKIEKMASVMEQRPEIGLLCCKFQIMDAEDRVMHGILAGSGKETFAVRQVAEVELLQAFYWLGMLMCVRKSFLGDILPYAKDLSIAHDRVLSHCAADRGQFYDYDYIGAYHRRHENNTAREEHRVSKLLDLQKKLKEIAVTEKLWTDMLEADLPLSEESRQRMRQRTALLLEREKALCEKSVSGVLRLYKKDGGKYLRKKSLICDVWLALFGKRG